MAVDQHQPPASQMRQDGRYDSHRPHGSRSPHARPSKSTKSLKKASKSPGKKKKKHPAPSKHRSRLPPLVKATPTPRQPHSHHARLSRGKPHEDHLYDSSSSPVRHSFPDFADGTNVLDGLPPFLQERVLDEVGTAGLANFRSDGVPSALNPRDSPFDFPRSVDQGGFSLGMAPVHGSTSTEPLEYWPWPTAPLNPEGDSDVLQQVGASGNTSVEYAESASSSSFLKAIPSPRRAPPRHARIVNQLEGGETATFGIDRLYEGVRGRSHIRYNDDGEPLEYVEPPHYGLLDASSSSDDGDPSGDFVDDKSSASSSELSSASLESVERSHKRAGRRHSTVLVPDHPRSPAPQYVEQKWPQPPSRLTSPHTGPASVAMATRVSADGVVRKFGLHHGLLRPPYLAKPEDEDTGNEDEWGASVEDVSVFCVSCATLT